MRREKHGEAKTKGIPTDLVASLGYMSVKVPSPSSEDIYSFAVEQFFNNFHRTELYCVMTADHIEHGFHTLCEAAATEELKELNRIIDHIFILSYCNILVNDGSDRMREFLRREGKNSTFPTEFLESLEKIDEDSVDSYGEIAKFLMNPASFDFTPQFYENLNKYLRSNPIPGMIFLLKYFLHDEREEEQKIPLHTKPHNKYINQWGRSDQLFIPFSESNVPQIVQRTHQYSEFKTTRNIPSMATKRPGARPPHLPSLISMTTPLFAQYACIDEKTRAITFSFQTQLFYSKFNDPVLELRPHPSTISAVACSSCGRYILSCDIAGNIRLLDIETGKYALYHGVKEMITTVDFIDHMFAVGTLSGKVFVFQTDQTSPVRYYCLHKSGVTFIKIHPNCENLVSVSSDGFIRLYSISLGNCARIWKAPGKNPVSGRFSHDGKLLIVACLDGSLDIIDIGASKVIRSMAIDAAVIDAIYSHNDQMIAIVDKTGGFSLWDANDVNGDSLIVLRIDKIKPFFIRFFENDEVCVVGCSMPHRYFEESKQY